MDYKKILLNRLLDKYEKSSAYLEGTARRRIILKFNAQQFPEYDIEKTETRELVNSVVQDLTENGLIKFAWLKFEQGNIIEKVWLCLDKLEASYREVGRVSKKDRVGNVLLAVQRCRQRVITPWIAMFLEATTEGIKDRMSLTPFLPNDEELALAVLTALCEIENKGEEECLERVFSLRCFGDSKYFERQLRDKIVNIVWRYNLQYEDNMMEAPTESEILAQVGIVRAPEQIEFRGGIRGKLGGKEIDFSLFQYGATINSFTSKELEIIGFNSVQRVLFIENKANYLDYIFKEKTRNELVIYLGGFYSPAKGQFIRKIYEASSAKGLKYQHWGDIDVGGFRIFNRLKTEIINELKPFLMNKEALLAKKNYWFSFDKHYASELKKLLAREDYAEFQEVIDFMLENGVRLEQEAFL